MEKIYYVYIHIRLDTGSIFYVGKGKGRRAKTKWSRNIWWKRVTDKTDWISAIVQENMSESDAYLLEMWLIAKLRHEGVVLCNIGDGGEGMSSPNFSLRKPVNCSNGMRFDMIGCAAKWAGTSRENLSAAARGEYGQAGGYSWWFDGDTPKEYVSSKEKMAKTQSKRIERSDGVVFESLGQAAKSVGGSLGNISIAARAGSIIRYGYTWRYLE